jgi:transcriptional regulator of acetoin/glycerol metabolism
MAPGRGLSIEPSLVSALSGFHWPGNIRQLVNAVRTACALIDEDERMIGWIHLPDDLSEALRQPTTVITQSESVPPENLKELSKAAIAKAVELSNGNMSEAARRLGISRNTLYRKIAKCTRRETLR